MVAFFYVSAAILLAATTSVGAAPSFDKRQSCATLWGQCGGQGWTGPTTCCAGSTCVYSNPWYSQCLQGSSTVATTTVSKTTTTSSKTTTTSTTTRTTTTILPTSSTRATTTTTTVPKTSTTTKATTSTVPTTTAPSPTPTSAGGKLPYTGVNEAGAEFGNQKIPGVLNTDYTWPSTASLTFFVNNGMNIFRVPFLWERAQNPVNTTLIESYLTGLDATIDTITSLGAIAIIEPHNFGRYPATSSVIIGQSAIDNGAFNDFWTRIANRYKSRSNVWFNIMNEPHDEDTVLWVATAQSAVNAIRAAGFKNKLIVPGNYWTGGWGWYNTGSTGSVSNAVAFVGFTDPLNNFFIEAHQYLDSDGSGTHADCVSTAVGVERLTQFTNWARTNKFKTFLGEIGASDNTVCVAALENTFKFMEANSDVWQGFTYWAAGPWWPQNDVNEIEPRSVCGKLPCKTGIWNVIKNHLVNPPKTTTTTAPTGTPSPKPTSTIDVYNDGTLLNGATDASWSSTVNLAETSVKMGSSGSSIQATVAAGTYGAFSISYPPTIGPSNYQYIRFYISGSSPNIPSISIGVKDSAGTTDGIPIQYWANGATISAGSFTEIWVDLSLYATNGAINQIWWQDGGQGVSFNIDGISFRPTKA
ncbi:glycoside hydrolase superfamily [Cladochytrium replicatum]|nr:glycoside hydrolase superfamily [Cladochytrium replicatum]